MALLSILQKKFSVVSMFRYITGPAHQIGPFLVLVVPAVELAGLFFAGVVEVQAELGVDTQATVVAHLNDLWGRERGSAWGLSAEDRPMTVSQ